MTALESLEAQLTRGLESIQHAGWYLEQEGRRPALWLSVAHENADVPAQGWKLHVSASVGSAAAVLGRALPVLLGETASFKVAASLDRLGDLNRGDGGRSQVGKFLTVYPTTDVQAVRLAVALDEATAGLDGPRVPSDRPLRPGSLVHYRYGGFQEGWLQTPLGEVVAAIEGPDGSLQADDRAMGFRTPAWAEDPFLAAGVVKRKPPVDLVVAERYLTVEILNSTAETSVRLVIDLEGGACRVLKQARRNAGTAPGEPAAVRLRHEAAVLRALDGDPATPRVHDLFEHGEDLFLVMDHVEGLTLEVEVGMLGAEGTNLGPDRVTDWAGTVAEILCRLHRRGMVYGDLKSTHVLIGPDGRLRMIDFESVWPNPDPDGPMVMGTPGYMAPQRALGHPPMPSDDVYSFGALLYLMVTGAEPSQSPDRTRILERSVSLLNPSAPTALVQLIGRCLDPVAERRPTMSDVGELLARAATEPDQGDGRAPQPPRSGLDLARDVASRLHRSAVAAPDGGVTWLAEGSSQPPRRDIGGGAAGVVLALAQAAPVLDDPQTWGLLGEAAEWLAASGPLPGGPLPGLYVGEAGIGAALLRAGQVLDDDGLKAVAVGKGRLVASLPHASPDLYNGTAGRLRFHLMLWEATGEDEHLDAAVAAGEHLAAVAELLPGEEVQWRIPKGYDGASGKAYLGYAHGVAGIGDALLDLVDATGDDRIADLAAAAVRRLLTTAVPCLADGQGRNWPDEAGGNPVTPLWCHGAAGMARFLMRAMRFGLVDGVAEVAHGAARAAGEGARHAGPTQCHGLAGNIDVLVDAYVLTGDAGFLDEAHHLARLLSAFVTDPDGLEPQSFCAVRVADLMTGWAGLLTAFLRLSDPEIPHVLSVLPHRLMAVG